ncbi:uncharacterized protein CCOS01_06690 [Colletotrichum costaricense]|uniref:Uncharacterized protein n=1 Tax=Colletotrichum costaricense TaxID=1209916 RepID=A0AAI9YYZ7_9PEZI|nr:uncharacterized protein CCOS01_06690 [Colletotrichum costaricense]KAK1528856.1 hypothetical protein CCOS01_06690 [Colletotrichum costaricense]
MQSWSNRRLNHAVADGRPLNLLCQTLLSRFLACVRFSSPCNERPDRKQWGPSAVSVRTTKDAPNSFPWQLSVSVRRGLAAEAWTTLLERSESHKRSEGSARMVLSDDRVKSHSPASPWFQDDEIVGQPVVVGICSLDLVFSKLVCSEVLLLLPARSLDGCRDPLHQCQRSVTTPCSMYPHEYQPEPGMSVCGWVAWLVSLHVVPFAGWELCVLRNIRGRCVQRGNDLDTSCQWFIRRYMTQILALSIVYCPGVETRAERQLFSCW